MTLSDQIVHLDVDGAASKAHAVLRAMEDDVLEESAGMRLATVYLLFAVLELLTRADDALERQSSP